ncbi:hypothetical protein BJP36_40635 [Moorena producens JHB]|uniref:Uncharacterized protein n=1 Tax=Moorena producens (strain JHB) TaxID=1454205 RepID=A0A9Q9SS72_MOOP1|nr:hypothetical protein [Moorena producens]WAN68678.1 hypothetical protein BJP36_40635 [Moorena producens JHB]
MGEIGRLGDWEIGRLGDWEIGRLAEEKVVRLTATWYKNTYPSIQLTDSLAPNDPGVPAFPLTMGRI